MHPTLILTATALVYLLAVRSLRYRRRDKINQTFGTTPLSEIGARNVALIYTPLSEYDLTVTKSLKSNQPANQTHSQNHLSAIKNIKKGEEEKVNSLVEDWKLCFGIFF